MSSLNEFIQEIKSTGMANTNNFAVFIAIPKGVIVPLGVSSNLRKFCLFCNATELPGFTYSTTPIRTYGESREMPYEALFDTIDCNFYMDSDLTLKYFFDTWIQNIRPLETRSWNYYDDYTTTVEIFVLNRAEDEVYSVKLLEAYPKVLQPIQMSYDTSEVMKMNVTFQYKYWVSERVGTIHDVSTQYGFAGLEKQSFNIPSDYFTNNLNYQQVFLDRFSRVKAEVRDVAPLFSSMNLK